MIETKIGDLDEFIKIVRKTQGVDVVLYRGQREHKPLLPKIARANPTINTTSVEKKMLSELRRRGTLYLRQESIKDWDLLVYAQHFGMATRLLDWTSNPLAALWFACTNKDATTSSFVYVFLPDDQFLLDRSKDRSPFGIKHTKILKPMLNNNRIISQQGWFTTHLFNEIDKRFVALERHKTHSKTLLKVEIPGKIKKSLLVILDTLGVNQHSMFPSFEGLCGHLNWMYKANA